MSVIQIVGFAIVGIAAVWVVGTLLIIALCEIMDRLGPLAWVVPLGILFVLAWAALDGFLSAVVTVGVGIVVILGIYWLEEAL